MTRDEFQPATILNLLAAAWIQFMVHDWFVHKRSEDRVRRDSDAAGRRLRRAQHARAEERARPGARRIDPAARLRNLNSHWWDASMIYGCDAAMGDKLRTKIGGKLRHRADRAAAGRSRDRASLQRVHRQLVDRAGDAPHALHAGAQPHLRSARARAPRLERRAAVRQGAPDQLGADGQDPHRRVDARDPAAPDHPARR